MPHHRSLDELSLPGCWLTVGVFDGVHLGHRRILRRLVEGARAERLPAVVLTFHPHPAAVLGKQPGLKVLSTPDERAALLAGLGVDHVVTLTFDHQLAGWSAEDFMHRVQERLHARALLVGYDFALGRGREGDVPRLTELGEQFGYSLESFAAVTIDGQVVSSRQVRADLLAGAVESAAAGLGRPYRVSGPVVHGDGRGRTIDIPTANIAYPPERVLPANGVYACRAHVGGESHPAVVNVGIRPTFTPDRETINIEAHLLDLRGDLYDQELGLDFIARLRGEQKFTSVDALIAQIRADIQQARQILS